MEKYSHINDYFYFVVWPEKKEGKDVLLYCSGVNLDRFLPMLRGRLGLGSNPIISGLQLIKYDLCSLAISEGAIPRENQTGACAGITPAEGTWFTERLLIENASALSPSVIISFCVRGMVKRIMGASLSGHQVPEDLSVPAELQVHLDVLCRPVEPAKGASERIAA